MNRDSKMSGEQSPELQPIEPRLNDLFRESGLLRSQTPEAEIRPVVKEPGLNDLFRTSGLLSSQATGGAGNAQKQVREKTKFQQQRDLRKSFALGVFAVWGVLGGLAFASNINSSGDADAYETSTSSPVTELSTTTTVPSTVNETTTSIETTTTTEPAPPEVFEVGPGESLGFLSIPALCEDIEVVGYNEAENLNEIIGTGAAVVDRLVPESSDSDCEVLDEREDQIEAKTGIDLITRKERIRTSLITEDNPQGNVDFYSPIAGHEQGLNGGYTSVFPGQPGNSLIAGHGSTYSAPFADIGLLKPGDEAIFNRSDGTSYTYRVIESEKLPNDDYTPFLHYSNPDYYSTITIYRCGNWKGLSGSDDARFAVRLGLVG